jgi:hypothetical protein
MLMHNVNLDEAEFYGRTSTPAGRAPHPALECSRCGSSLAGRRVTVARARGLLVETFRCRCGRGRHVRREAATG